MALRNKIQKLFRLIGNDIKAILGNHILISASVNTNYDGQLYHSNIGDDLNYYFIREISSRPIIISSETLLAKYLCKNYLVIGSTIAMLSNKRTIVWGAGMIDEDLPANIGIRAIKAVRGPLTREVLNKRGFDCDSCYGDPALLLPLYYKRIGVKKKYDVGIIPHYADMELLKKLSNLKGIHVIPTRGYADWHSFIDEILQCRCIVSSSLHGLIIAEAYGVPSRWVEFGKAESRAHFKYHDFYLSIGKRQEPLNIDISTTKQDLIDECGKWEAGRIDLKKLIVSCPFPIRID